MWQRLRSRKFLNLKFCRQHPIGRFIVDFFCVEFGLVLEIDGSVHAGRVEYDQERTQMLEGYGYQVLRFSNQEVERDIAEVLDRIEQMLQSKDE